MTDKTPPIEPTSVTPVMLINPDASLQDLLAYTDLRIKTTKELMISLSCLNTSAMECRDVSAVADVAYLLLQDGSEVLDAARWRLT
ncbi:hypothetical protein [Pseudomonas sp. R5(2019)]|uniref:hypothetical protein n=1 Tax=Pseudomonas sp. R5(2019) TaxID=2697566 RepID=UPI0014126977|nr:hypothetical protein [Pseudomonas sp. R5(2019)]NBA94046.1 hypothetical protein [Pseudomonas sp. R5(2019)]